MSRDTRNSWFYRRSSNFGRTKAYWLIKAVIRLLGGRRNVWLGNCANPQWDFGRSDSKKLKSAFLHLVENPWFSRLVRGGISSTITFTEYGPCNHCTPNHIETFWCFLFYQIRSLTKHNLSLTRVVVDTSRVDSGRSGNLCGNLRRPPNQVYSNREEHDSVVRYPQYVG